MISGSNKPSSLVEDGRSGINADYLGNLDDSQLELLIQKLYIGEIDPTSFLSGLVEGTESMEEDEKGYWFDIIPSMGRSQIEKLIRILVEEKRKLKALERKYHRKIKALNDKAMKAEK